METTAFDDTTAGLFNSDVPADAFRVPTGGTKAKVRVVAHVRTGVQVVDRHRRRRLPRRGEHPGR